MDALETYKVGQTEAAARLREQDARIGVLSTARLVVAGLALVIVIGLVWAHFPEWTMSALGLLVAGFVALIVVHSRAFLERSRTEALQRFHERGLARLVGTWRAFPETGASYASETHPFADDLDLFGPSSLFQLLDATETPFGRDTLANAVLLGAIRDDGAGTETWDAHLREEQAAVRELAPALKWREKLSVEGALLRVDAPKPEPFLEWAVGQSPVVIPGAVVVLAYVLPLLALGLAVGAVVRRPFAGVY